MGVRRGVTVVVALGVAASLVGAGALGLERLGVVDLRPVPPILVVRCKGTTRKTRYAIVNTGDIAGSFLLRTHQFQAPPLAERVWLSPRSVLMRDELSSVAHGFSRPVDVAQPTRFGLARIVQRGQSVEVDWPARSHSGYEFCLLAIPHPCDVAVVATKGVTLVREMTDEAVAALLRRLEGPRFFGGGIGALRRALAVSRRATEVDVIAWEAPARMRLDFAPTIRGQGVAVIEPRLVFTAGSRVGWSGSDDLTGGETETIVVLDDDFTVIDETRR